MAKTVIRVLGRETVEVPAGVFEDCVRIEMVTRNFARDLRDPGTPRTQWYHCKAGLVKFETRTPNGVCSGVLTKDERVAE